MHNAACTAMHRHHAPCTAQLAQPRMPCTDTMHCPACPFLPFECRCWHKILPGLNIPLPETRPSMNLLCTLPCRDLNSDLPVTINMLPTELYFILIQARIGLDQNKIPPPLIFEPLTSGLNDALDHRTNVLRKWIFVLLKGYAIVP